MDNLSIKVHLFPSVAPVVYRIFLKTASALFLTPFAISNSNEAEDSFSSVWIFKTSLIRKGICCILHTLSVVIAALNLRFANKNKIRENPDSLFLIFVNFIMLAYNVTFVYTMWRKQRFLLDILNAPALLVSPKLIYCMFFLNFLSIAFNIVVGIYWNSNIFTSEIPFPESYLKDEAEKLLLKDFGIISESISPDNIASLLFIYITLFFEALSSVVNGMTEMLVMLSTYVSCKATFTPLTSATDRNILNLLQKYRSLENLVDCINRVVAPMVLLVFICIVSFLSQTFIDVLDSKDDWQLRGLMTIFYIFYGTILFFGAETHKQTSSLKHSMLMKMYANDEDNNSDFRLTLADLKSLPEIGLMGGSFFMVSYETVGMLILTIVMYSIIMIQFKVGSTSTMNCNCTAQYAKTE